MSELVLKEMPAAAWSEAPAHPWHRFFARMVDMWLNGVFYLFFAMIVLFAVAPHSLEGSLAFLFSGPGRLVDLMLTAFVGTFINAALISYTGGTLGKFLFGIRVLDDKGDKIGYIKALKREFSVWFKGLGLGALPILPFTMYASFKFINKEGKASWDQNLNLRVEYKHYTKTQKILSVIGLILSTLWILTILEAITTPWLQ